MSREERVGGRQGVKTAFRTRMLQTEPVFVIVETVERKVKVVFKSFVLFLLHLIKCASLEIILFH